VPDLFKALVHSIVAQQNSRKAADTVYWWALSAEQPE
jgi:3-methyladenine DNA glycosylase/8-oxoguanine DNA glycosylase